MDTDFHRIYDMKREILNNPRPIIIGENVWVGCRATILKGSNVPDGSIIASGALVAGDLKEINGMYGGVPAKLLRSGVKWKL